MLDVHAGIIHKAANLPGWQDVPLAEMIHKHFDLPVYLANDANLAALAEWKYGAGRGHDSLIYLTVSTGIGGGLISGGKLITGAKGLAGEVGHITVVENNGPLCGCGQRGCLEAVASGPAIARRAAERIANGGNSRVLDLVHGRLQDITPEVITLAASEGDPLACEVFNEAGNYIGRILASLMHLHSPSMVVIGGGVTKAGDSLLNPIRSAVRQHVLNDFYRENCPVVRAELGEDRGLLGGLAWVLDKERL